MSLINQLNATTEMFWLQVKPEDILNKASALLWKLMGNAIARDNWEVKPHETVDGGLMVKVPLEYANSNRGAYGADTVIPQDKKNLLDAARFRWGGIMAANTLNLDDKTQNTGDAAVIHLTKVYMKSIMKSARVQMAEDIVASASTDYHILGLGNLFNTTTSTEYGSIDEDEMSDWKANVITTDEAINFKTMQAIFRAPDMGGHSWAIPNFCCTTQLLRDAYERTLHTQQRFTMGKMIEAGWDHIMHKQAPIVADAGYTAGTLDALNLQYLHLRSHKDYNFTKPVWLDKAVLGQPDTDSANTRWRGNLYCTHRKMHVRHTNLTEPA